MNIYEKLLEVQNKLKAPKSQYNDYGKYKYRNCEDILEAVKPLTIEVRALVYLTDTVELIGDRYYIKATATFVDCEKPEQTIVVTAYAREEKDKKGMDGSQVTGASSSYARKYALNGLFDIDDTKDSDTTNNGQNIPNDNTKNTKNAKRSAPQSNKSSNLSEFTRAELNARIATLKKLTGKSIQTILGELEIATGISANNIATEQQASDMMQRISQMIEEVTPKEA